MARNGTAKQAIMAKNQATGNISSSGNIAIGPKNVPGTTGNVGGVVRNAPTPSIFDNPSLNQTGATLNINSPSTPYNSSIYGQINATANPNTSYFGQTYGTQNQGMLPQNVGTPMQASGVNQFGSQIPTGGNKTQSYSPISQGLADYNMSQPSTSGGSQALKAGMTQSANIAQAGQQNLGNYFAQGNYQALTQAQQTADAMSKMYETKTAQQQQIEKAIAEKQALDLKQQALAQDYQAKSDLTKMQYTQTIANSVDSLNKAQAGIMEAVGNDIVNMTALGDAKGNMMKGQMILDNLHKSQSIELDQIAFNYTNQVQQATNQFLANNSRLGIAASGMLKELEANGALDTAKGQAEAMALLQSTYTAIGQSAQGYAQSLQYLNQYASQQADIAYKNASLNQQASQFNQNYALEQAKFDFQREAANLETKIDNVTGVSTITNKKTGEWEMRDQEGNVISSGKFGGIDSGLTDTITSYTNKYSGNNIKTGKECAVTSREFNEQTYDDPTRFGVTLDDKKRVLANAAKGGRVSNVPIVGSTAIFDVGTKYGHTATVFGVKDDGTLIVYDSNYGKAVEPGKTGDGIARVHEMKPNSVVGYYLPPKLKQQMSGNQTQQAPTQAPSLYDKITSFITGGATQQPAQKSGVVSGKTKGGVELSGSALNAYQSKSITDSPMDKRVITELERKGVFNEGTGNKAFYLNSTKTRPAINTFIQGLEKWEQAKEIMKRNDDSYFGSFNNLKQMMGGYDRAWLWLKGKTGTGTDKFMNDYNTLTTILGQELAAYMKNISGATVSNSERETLSKQIPNLETMNERQFESNVKLYDEAIERQKKEIMSDWGFNSWDDVMEVMRRQGGAPGTIKDIDSLSDDIINNK